MKLLALVLSFLSIFIPGRTQQLFFNHLSVNNGLSQGVNNCIYRDSRGFVWISSFDGLNRFDGMTCTRFRASGDNGLKGTLFLHILEDQQSNLWIGSNEGLNFYDRRNDRFINFRIQDKSNSEQFVSPFYIDDRNNVWVQSNSSILIFDPNKKIFTVVDNHFPGGSLIIKPLPAKPFKPLERMLVISNKLPVLFEGILIGNHFTWKSSTLDIEARKVNAMTIQNGQQVWLGTDQGLYSFDRDRKMSQSITENGVGLINISSLHVDSTGTLWAGTFNKGLFQVDTKKNRVVQQYKNSNFDNRTLSGNQVQYISTDAYGILWVALWGKGVDYTSASSFNFQHHITLEDATKTGTDNFIRSIIEVGAETWCGTQSGGILVLDSNSSVMAVIREALPASIEHLALDNSQHIWVATFDGLFVVDAGSRRVIKAPLNEIAESNRSNQYNYLIKCADGAMLASTNAGLFFVRKAPDGWRFSEAKGVNTDDVYLTSFIDSRGTVYVSRAFKGFSEYSMVGDSLIKIGGLPIESTIKCFLETNDSTLWIGSTTGLVEFSTEFRKPKRVITTKNGLSNHYIYGVVAAANDLWLSTNAGINRFNVTTGSVKWYTEADGLQSNEFNTYAYLKKRNGQVLFGGINGINVFNPGPTVNVTAAPNLALTRIHLNDSLYFPGVNPTEVRDLSIDYKHNTIGFEFTVISFHNAAANTVEYMLEGYDRSWVRVANKTQIRYANLPAGEYFLKVKGFDADGTLARNQYRLILNVSAPWWQTWWFRLLVFLSVAAIVGLMVRGYIQRKLERHRNEMEKRTAVEAERNRISRDMHDDLGSGLTKIAILSEVVKKQLNEPEKAKEQLEKIANSSRELVDSLQDIIWVLNPKNDSLESLSAYIREYGLKFLDDAGIILQFKYPDVFLNQFLSEEQRRNIFLTVKETFNNILRHSGATHVFVTIAENKGSFRIRIADDGKGFVMDEVRTFANGLKNMKSRIESSGGLFEMASSPSMGTRVDITYRL